MPGTAWIYRGESRFAAVCFDDIDVLRSGGERGFFSIVDLPLSGRIQDLIHDCAQRDLSIPEALEEIKATFGEPVEVVHLENVNEPDNDLIAAVERLSQR
ncbi:hypothetical protein GC425_06960 [Corynebacterium sp. zg254]|uniref:Uncharacterized protein n=1 Tax=Corynebacterium zhongnanshanii TaxID=2768834 RepID=A0ABQ6VDN7_9CORY|nr:MULTISPECIES: hypothetical protein [Corynebacterium]KAB3520968.1 hypothetical protein F8377_06980 [Corynebacterium zhongnanshanii]MCR5914601.1 hypothetical protein [Corynebacterium sp. zg254]